MASQPAKKPASPSKSAAGSSSGDPMDVDRLERLVALMGEAGLTSLELQDGEKRISLSRGGPAPAAAAPAPAFAAAPAAAPAPAAASAATPAPAADASTAGLKEITSPMVGTFYTAPKPGAPAFVSIGGKVTADSDVCIIEAMKVFNTIKADVGGTIEKILVADGDPVEFGQPLFLVKP